jgi:hypothetical protein
MDAVKRGLPKDMVEGDGEEAASLLPAARLRDLLGPEVELLAPRVRKEWDAAGPKLGQVVGVLPGEKKNTPCVCWWREGNGQNIVRREMQFANERLLDRFVQRDPCIRISSSVLLRPDDYVILSRPVDARNLIRIRRVVPLDEKTRWSVVNPNALQHLQGSVDDMSDRVWDGHERLRGFYNRRLQTRALRRKEGFAARDEAISALPDELGGDDAVVLLSARAMYKENNALYHKMKMTLANELVFTMGCYIGCNLGLHFASKRVLVLTFRHEIEWAKNQLDSPLGIQFNRKFCVLVSGCYIFGVADMAKMSW